MLTSTVVDQVGFEPTDFSSKWKRFTVVLVRYPFEDTNWRGGQGVNLHLCFTAV